MWVEIEILLMLYAIHNHADSVQGEGNSLDISFLMYEIEILLAGVIHKRTDSA